MDAKKLLEQRYMELQLLTQQLVKVREQLQRTDERIAEVQFVIDSLKEFEHTSSSQEILVPVTNGVFTTASLKDPSKLLVNVGADTVVEKSIPEACEMLDRQKQQIQDFRKRLAALVNQMHDKTEELQQQIREMKV